MASPGRTRRDPGTRNGGRNDEDRTEHVLITSGQNRPEQRTWPHRADRTDLLALE
jgi:hypothetical protein